MVCWFLGLLFPSQFKRKGSCKLFLLVREKGERFLFPWSWREKVVGRFSFLL